MELLKLVCTQNQCKGNGLQYIGVLKCPFCTTSLSPDLSIIKSVRDVIYQFIYGIFKHFYYVFNICRNHIFKQITP